jgi:hypothetical protein
MSNSEEERIKKLLNDLPKAPPMSEIEIKRFEKFIDVQVEGLKSSKSTSTRNRNFSIAAALVLVVGGGAIFASQNNSLLKGTNLAPTSVSSPTNAPSAASTANSNPGGTNSNPDQSHSQGSPNQVYGDSESKKPIAGIYMTGLAYDGDLTKIRAIVKKSDGGSLLSRLTNNERNCAIQQGVGNELIAFDIGTYQSAPTYAFFTGKEIADATILLTDESCVVLDQINK